MGVLTYIEEWTGKNADGKTESIHLNWGDYSPEGIEQLKERERLGAVIYAVYEDGTMEHVAAESVTDPNHLEIVTVEKES